ncbi:MAG: hypothetical protein L0332_28040 [Chloroflexi bacterium]|nr:hypothetical protein [Chloroflexota bacterium]MCI0574784.1 hypothetical protein [Chloroflexota bacterium]MCI0648859.1 hypothetical protein [Chloroflexota bacterium]MCI0730551.1 hypothetical protein [Chloroflexota bacterium]
MNGTLDKGTRGQGDKETRALSPSPSLPLSILLIAILLALAGPAAAAQTYYFSVPELRMQVFVQPDASARIVYDITFLNQGTSIDIVDIGVPHDNYDIGNMSASINGVALDDIRVSEFVDPGVEVHLLAQAIGPGAQGTLHVEFTMPDMVYQDTTRNDYASLQITPTWFDSQFVNGTSDVWVLMHMLPGIQPDEVLFQDEPFTDKVFFEDHIVVAWRWPEGSATGPNLVGASFPQRGLTRVVKQSILDLAIKWLEDNPGTRFFLGAITVVLLAFAFLRFSGGTGFTLLVIAAFLLVWLLANSVGSVLLALPAMALLAVFNERSLSRRKRRYLPAIAQVEGGGIKRGLTAPEAAALLELPLNKVLTLVIFGLLEKGVVRPVADTPLEVRVNPEFETTGKTKAEERRAHRRQVAQKLGAVVRDYEHDFLDVLEKSPGRALQEIDFSGPMKELLQQTADRIKGFDLSDTQDYYRKIIKRALEEARRIGEIPEREKFLDRHMQWLLMNDDYRHVFVAPDYYYRPVWVRPYTSADRIGGPSLPSAKPSSGGPGGKTSFGDVAASFAGWTENTMGSLASAIAPGALQVKGDKGAVNLSGVDRVTGDIFKAMGSSSGSGGRSGGGSSCACACAGCACACACAGGGR